MKSDKENNVLPALIPKRKCESKNRPAEKAQTNGKDHRPLVTYTGKRRKKRFRKFIVALLTLLLLTFLCYRFLEKNLSERIAPLAAAEARRYLGTHIDNAVTELVLQNAVDYSDLIYEERSADGEITSLVLNEEKINQIRVLFMQRIDEHIKKEPVITLQIPFGTILHDTVFSGIQTSLPVKMKHIGTVSVDIYTHMEESTSLRTRHLVEVEMTARATVMIPGDQIEAESRVVITVAERIILQKTPGITLKTISTSQTPASNF